MNTKTVEIGQARRHDRPPLLRALEYLLYAVLFVVLVVPPAFVYGLIIKDAANFRDYEDVRNFYDTPGFEYGIYRKPPVRRYYGNIPVGTRFEYDENDSDFVFFMLENPAHTLWDGMTVGLWQLEDDGGLVYVLENGDFLLRIDEPDYIGWQRGLYGISDHVAEKITTAIKARLPYDVEQSLDWIYDRTKGRDPRGGYGLTEVAGYNTDVTLATDEYLFIYVSNYAVGESGETVWLPDAYLIFDRGTGEQVSIDRLCVGGSFEDIKLELTRRMLEPKDDYFPPYVDYTFTEQDIDTFAGALSPELISFGDEGLRAEVRVKISVYPDEGYVIGARYEALEDLITFEP